MNKPPILAQCHGLAGQSIGVPLQIVVHVLQLSLHKTGSTALQRVTIHKKRNLCLENQFLFVGVRAVCNGEFLRYFSVRCRHSSENGSRYEYPDGHGITTTV